MKSKKMHIEICVILIIAIGSLIWWNAPISIINIEPSDVSKICVFDGKTGKSITIADVNDIEQIIKNFKVAYLKKDKISLGYMGYSYRTTVYKVNGDVYNEFIIDSSDVIRKDPFFYKDRSGCIDYDYKYIQKLFDKNIR